MYVITYFLFKKHGVFVGLMHFVFSFFSFLLSKTSATLISHIEITTTKQADVYKINQFEFTLGSSIFVFNHKVVVFVF